MNVKNYLKGKLKRDNYSNPVFGAQDEKLEYLRKFILWLEEWKKHPKCKGLTDDTHAAALLTTRSMIAICEYVFAKFPDVKYVLLGKIQSDPIEARFGRYRNLSGCNYNISVAQVMEAEKKIRLHRLLKTNSLQDLLSSLSIEEEASNAQMDVKEFIPILYSDEYLCSNPYEVLDGQCLYVCGSVAHSIKGKLSCTDCIALLFSETQDRGTLSGDPYFDSLQRGGLCFPSDSVVLIFQHTYAIFEFILCQEQYRLLFLQKHNQKCILKALTFHSLDGDSRIFPNKCPNPGHIIKIITLCLSILLATFF